MTAPAYVADHEIAYMLGRKTAWLRKHRAALMAEGFPPKDRIIGLTIKADVEAWIARRRVLADRVEAAITTAATTTKLNLENLHEL